MVQGTVAGLNISTQVIISSIQLSVFVGLDISLQSLFNDIGACHSCHSPMYVSMNTSSHLLRDDFHPVSPHIFSQQLIE